MSPLVLPTSTENRLSAEAAPATKAFPLPDGIKLFNVMNQFLIRWANLSAQYVGMHMEDHSALPLEHGIHFFEPFEGILVIRSTHSFEKFLVELYTGKKPERDFHEKGIFLEMSVLFWHLLVAQAWKMDARKLKPALLRTSIPMEWPDRKPDSACTLFIKDFPLEMRLWSKVSPEETKYWDKKARLR